MSALKTVKVVCELRPRENHRRESRAPFIRLRGHWLEAHGFQVGSIIYVYNTLDGLLLSPTPPTSVVLTSLDQLKAQFLSVGIPTTRPQRKDRP